MGLLFAYYQEKPTHDIKQSIHPLERVVQHTQERIYTNQKGLYLATNTTNILLLCIHSLTSIRHSKRLLLFQRRNTFLILHNLLGCQKQCSRNCSTTRFGFGGAAGQEQSLLILLHGGWQWLFSSLFWTKDSGSWRRSCFAARCATQTLDRFAIHRNDSSLTHFLRNLGRQQWIVLEKQCFWWRRRRKKGPTTKKGRERV